MFLFKVVCTSHHSSLHPRADGEVRVSLVNGRPGAGGPSRTLVHFTTARFVRMRFHKMAVAAFEEEEDADSDDAMRNIRLRQYFYR